MNRTIILSLTILMFCGCDSNNSYYWYQRGNTLEQARRDCQQCYLDSMAERITTQHAASQDAQVTHSTYLPEAENAFDNQFESISFDNCMKAKGYRPVLVQYLPASAQKKWCSPTSESHYLIAGE